MLDIIKQRRWMILTIVILVLLNLGLITGMMMHDRHPGKFDRRSGGFESFLKDELQLTPVQIDSFKAIRTRHFKAGAPLMKAMRDSMDAMMSEAFNPQPDTLHVKVLSKQLAEMHREMDWSFYQHFAQLSGLCTPEQRERLEVFAKDLTHRMGPSRKSHDRPETPPPPEKP